MALNEYVVMSDFPAVLAAVVTPSDSVDLAQKSRGLYVGVAGDVNVDMTDGTTILFKNAQAGGVIPISVKRVRATSTVATNIVALY